MKQRNYSLQMIDQSCYILLATHHYYQTILPPLTVAHIQLQFAKIIV
jgi:hypothetical protein